MLHNKHMGEDAVLKRASRCCRAPVIHNHRIDDPDLDRALSLVCKKCRKPADKFNVVFTREKKRGRKPKRKR